MGQDGGRGFFLMELREPLIVGGWAVDRRNRAVGQPEIDSQLAAVVRQVVQRVTQHDMTRLIEHDLSSCEQPPVRRHQELVGRPGQRLTALLHVRVVHGNTRVGSRLLVGVLAGLVREVLSTILKRRPASGKWSAHEDDCHLAVVHELFFQRLEQMLTMSAPFITPYDPDADDRLLAMDLEDSLQRYTNDRGRLVARLRDLSASTGAGRPITESTVTIPSSSCSVTLRFTTSCMLTGSRSCSRKRCGREIAPSSDFEAPVRLANNPLAEGEKSCQPYKLRYPCRWTVSSPVHLLNTTVVLEKEVMFFICLHARRAARAKRRDPLGFAVHPSGHDHTCDVTAQGQHASFAIGGVRSIPQMRWHQDCTLARRQQSIGDNR
jgi:DinB superfamily